MQKKPIPALDDTDFKILNSALERKHKGLKEMGKALGISITTLHDRINKLKEASLIKSITSFDVDLAPLGYDETAIIEIGVKNDAKRKEIVKFCLNSNIVTSVYETAGTYDIIVMLKYKSTLKLKEFLHNIYKQFPNIETETIIAYIAHRDEKNPFPISAQD